MVCVRAGGVFSDPLKKKKKTLQFGSRDQYLRDLFAFRGVFLPSPY